MVARSTPPCRCGGGEGPRLLKGDGEFYRTTSIFPVPGGGAEGGKGGVVLFRLNPLRLKEGQSTAPDVTTNVAMRVDAAGGGRRVAHYTVDIPCVRPKERDDGRGFSSHYCDSDLRPPAEFKDVFQTKAIRKAVALWYYTEFSRHLLRAHRSSSGLERRIVMFKEYFEAASRAVSDDAMLKEVALWDQLVDIKQESLKRNSRCCSVM